jgi:hypothetical protein
MAQNFAEDDFEVIESPEVTESKTHAQCSDPLCQRSHSTFIEEEASDRAIDLLLTIMQATAKEVQTKGPIFHLKSENKKDASDRDAMFDTFTESLPLQHRRVMNCQACRRFMRQFGDLCVVGDDGSVIPLTWPLKIEAVPAYYRPAVTNVLKLFKGKEVGDEFKLSKGKGTILGIPVIGGWRHMSIELENAPVSRTYVDSQDTSTSFTMLDRILHDNTPEIIAKVSHLVLTDQLPYATSHKAPLEWLQNTAGKLAAKDLDTVQRKNLVSRYSREAFVGCLSSLRGGLLGYLFECVREGQTFEALKQNWESKAGPTVYLRPTAAPSVGNIKTAERIFANMGYTEEDLKRVFLTLDEVPQSGILWPPAAATALEGQSEETPPPPPYSTTAATETPIPESKPKPQGIFSSLLPIRDFIPIPKTPPYASAPIKEITFRHFALRILPTAQNIHVLPTNPKTHAYFFTRSSKTDAKPLFAFHNSGSHTASWYTWSEAAPLSTAHLSQEYTSVKAILTFPHMWDFISPLDALDDEKCEAFKFKRHGIRYLFVLEGVKDMQPTELCLFPALLKSEFHGVRGTIEAFSKRERIEVPERGDHVGGFEVAKERAKKEEMVVGVETKAGQVARYRITLFE